MCKKTNYKTSNPRVDKCMVDFITTLKSMCGRSHIKPVACCCGHGKYPMTVIVKNGVGYCWELISGIEIPRKKRFYKRDLQGYYYIPELR